MKIRIVHHVEETWVSANALSGEEVMAQTLEEHTWRPVLVGGNGERVWWAEHYTTKQKALDAVHLIAEAMGVASRYEGTHFTFTGGLASPVKVDIEWIDERNED